MMYIKNRKFYILIMVLQFYGVIMSSDIEWKSVRIRKDVWKEVKKLIAGEDIDLDDFLSYIIYCVDLEPALTDYLLLLKEEQSEDKSEKEDKSGD